jgi:hypothetical protein
MKLSESIPLTNQLNITIVANHNPDMFGLNSLTLFGMSGVDAWPWPSLTCPNCEKIILELSLSAVEFYVNNTRDYKCEPNLVPDDSTNTVSLFSTYIKSLSFDYGNAFLSGSSAICPYVFKNANIDTIHLNFQADSFLFTSLLRFQHVNDSAKFLSIKSFISGSPLLLVVVFVSNRFLLVISLLVLDLLVVIFVSKRFC